MKSPRTSHARQVGITSLAKVKRPGNKFYQGGTDGNKGRKKKRWFEQSCWNCDHRDKVEPGKLIPCTKCGFRYGA